MAFRKKHEGKVTIEQIRDFAAVRAMLADAGMLTEGVGWPPACYLFAYFGKEPVGVIGVEPMLDSALIRSLYVKNRMRRRGIGAELLREARKAAHTRGARSLYLFSTGAGGYFARLGFARVPVEQLVSALSGTPQLEYYKTRPDELALEVAWFLDISNDGVIVR